MPDNLTPKQRSYCMSQIKGKDTAPEMRVRSELHRRGLRFRKHVRSVPGRPDVVFPKAKVAVFIDGDFWHGYLFDEWAHKMSDSWRSKIARTRQRDAEIQQRLHGDGWTVIRLWEHDIDHEFENCIGKILRALAARASREQSQS